MKRKSNQPNTKFVIKATADKITIKTTKKTAKQINKKIVDKYENGLDTPDYWLKCSKKETIALLEKLINNVEDGLFMYEVRNDEIYIGCPR